MPAEVIMGSLGTLVITNVFPHTYAKQSVAVQKREKCCNGVEFGDSRMPVAYTMDNHFTMFLY